MKIPCAETPGDFLLHTDGIKQISYLRRDLKGDVLYSSFRYKKYF